MNKLKIAIAGTSIFITILLIIIIGISFVYAESAKEIITLIIFIFVFDASFGFYILNSKRYVNVKMCWIFIVLLLPLFGPLLFLMFGVNPWKRKDSKAYNSNKMEFMKYEDFSFSKNSVKNQNIVFKYLLENSLNPIYEHNDISIIHETPELYAKTIDLIRGAKKFIHLQSYILRDGFWLRSILTELVLKAQAGVKVRIIYDCLGSAKRIKKSTIKELKKYNIEIAGFNPIGFNVLRGLSNFRGHRKVMIIDNEIAYFGGSNFSDEYLCMSERTNFFRDLNFIIVGEVVNSFNLLFCLDWFNVTRHSITQEQKEELKTQLPKILKIDHSVKKTVLAQVVETSPNYTEKTIKNLFLSLISKAVKSIYIASPYFIPTDDIITALTTAAWSGVDVKIVVPGEFDKSFISLMNRNNYSALMKAGVKFYEYDGFIHSKYTIIDDKHCLIGSYNLDFRSFFINFENAVLLESREFVIDLKRVFDKDIKNSKEVTWDMVKKWQTLLSKTKISFINIYQPLL